MRVESADFDINFTSAQYLYCITLWLMYRTHMLHIINTTCGLCISGDICIFEGIYYWLLPEQSLLLDIDEYTGYL